MSKLTIIEGNSNDKDDVRVLMVKGEKGEKGENGADGKDGKDGEVTNEYLEQRLNQYLPYTILAVGTVIDGKGSADYSKTEIDINYPTGYTEANTIVLACQIENVNGTVIGAYGNGLTASDINSTGAYPRIVSLQANKIVVSVYNYNSTEDDVYITLTLMKNTFNS